MGDAVFGYWRNTAARPLRLDCFVRLFDFWALSGLPLVRWRPEAWLHET
jgi:hypothetical protein